MTNIDETMNKIDSLLTDRGLTSEYKEQAVRHLLYHLYIALDIYRYMTYSEKNKAGYWYRMFRSSFSLTGFLKERKRKRDKEKSPLHPKNLKGPSAAGKRGCWEGDFKDRPRKFLDLQKIPKFVLIFT